MATKNIREHGQGKHDSAPLQHSTVNNEGSPAMLSLLLPCLVLPVEHRGFEALEHLCISTRECKPDNLDLLAYAFIGVAANTLAAASICARVIISVAHHSVALRNSGYQRLKSMPPTIFASSSRWLHSAGDSSVCRTNSWKRGAPVNNCVAPGCEPSFWAA